MLALNTCDNDNCVGDVGKWGPFYMKYIGSMFGLNAINPEKFMKRWDIAIVEQLNAATKMQIAKSVEDLKSKPQYKLIQESRKRWKKEAEKWGKEMWEKKAKEGIAKRRVRSKTV